MLRLNNPYNVALEQSCAFMEFESDDVNFNQEVVEEIRKRGGQIHRISNSTSRYVLEISHKHIDGLGLTYLHNALGLSASAKPISSNEGQACGILSGDYVYIHVWSKTEPISGGQTFLQRFLQHMIRSFPELENENIGIVVNLEEPLFKSLDSVWGNSIAAVPIAGNKIIELSEQPKRVWKDFLVSRASRTLNILRKKSFAEGNYGSLLVSSIGDLSSLPWLSETTESSLKLGATPINPRMLNLILWANHGVQSILLCGKSDHSLYKQSEKVIGVWKTVIAR